MESLQDIIVIHLNDNHRQEGEERRAILGSYFRKTDSDVRREGESKKRYSRGI